MNAAPGVTLNNGSSAEELDARLRFFKALQGVTNKIHATGNLEEIMLDLSQDICDLFHCDRLTLYAVSEDRAAIVSKIKTGLNSFKDFRLPISPQSIAGYVALSRRILNIRDVYDDAELKRHAPELHFQRGVDQQTGYRTRQMLAAPLVDERGNELLGAIQLINHREGRAFSVIEEDGLRELCKTLAIAYARRLRASPARSRYDALVTDSVLSAAELELAMRSARRKTDDVEHVLTRDFQVPLAAIGQALSRAFGVPYEPYRSDRIKPGEHLRHLKREFVEASRWLPIEENQDGLVILATDPEQVRSARTINTIYPKARLHYRVTTLEEFRQTVEQFFGVADTASVDELLSGMEGPDDEAGETGEAELSAAADNELVRLVNKIIVDAYRQGASDIHIEPRPGKEKTLIRFRKDGVLEPYIEIPGSYRAALATRIKIMCDLDISERRKPQDGKIRFRKFGPLDIELRVATIPSAGGVEDIVLRILAAGEPVPLDRLGVLTHNLDRLKALVSKPHGLFFVCGPTGSGKTTSLHSVLHFLNTPGTKIWTAEDPVEITQKGLRQVQVNRKSGLDFAAAMRAFLRADPDVIMVGEMRDHETVSMGIEASLTGHLVLATLHTNGAPESITRLLDMGMDPFNFADALLGVLAQRLARRLCVNCRQAYTPSEEEMRLLLAEYCEELKRTESFARDRDAAEQAILARWARQYGDAEGHFRLYRAVGCDQCNGGYKGRVGLHELMSGTDRLKRLIQERKRMAELLAAALEDGMQTLKMDGIEKVLAGITDIRQVRMVCIK